MRLCANSIIKRLFSIEFDMKLSYREILFSTI